MRLRYTSGVKWVWILLIAAPLLAQNCVPPFTLNPNDSQTAEVTAAGCVLSDGTAALTYRVIFPVRGSLQLTATGTGFSPWLILRDEDGYKVDSGASIRHSVEAGAYYAVVNSLVPAASGSFALTSVFVPESNILCTQFRHIGPSQTVSGQLTGASCKLPDKSPFDGWLTTVYGSGTLTVTMRAASFGSFLILRGENGAALGQAANDGTGKDTQIGIPVSGNETYTVIAAAVNQAAPPGSYQLTTAFTPADDETCRPLRQLTDSIQVNGSVSAASCSSGSSLFNFYAIHIGEPGLAQISVPASTFNPLLMLLDSSGNQVAEDSQSGGVNSPLIRQPLLPGDYRLLIFDQDSSAGDYRILYRFVPGTAAACPVHDIASGIPANGTLSGDASCRMGDLLSDIYRIVLPADGSLDLTLSSGDFTGFLELRDAKDNLLQFGASTGDGSSAHLQTSLAAGTYFLSAATAGLPGSYGLLYQFTPQALPACTKSQDLPMNTGYVARLGQGSCIGADGRYVDTYRFSTPTDGTAAFVMESSDLDSLLTLKDSTGKAIRMDDNSYNQNDAIIVQYLNAGNYTVEARGRTQSPGGLYRVDALFTPGARPGFCEPVPIQIGARRNAVLSYTSCPYYDGTFADIYQFDLIDGTKPVATQASSSEFNIFLTLSDSKGNILATGDAGGGRFDSQLTSLLDPGSYFVTVHPLGDSSQSGRYTLSIQQ